MSVSIFHLFVVVSALLCLTADATINNPFRSVGAISFSTRRISRVEQDLSNEESSSSIVAGLDFKAQLQSLKEQDNIMGYVVQNLEVFKRGFTDLVPSLKNAWRLREKSKREGPLSLTYEETKKIEVAKNDLIGLASKAFFFSAAKEWFFFSNVLFPLMSANNPWIWVQTFPSSFDDPKFKAMRETIVQQRRVQTLFGALEQQQKETMEDIPLKLRQERKSQMDVIARALEKKASLSEAYNILEPLLVVAKDARNMKGIRFNKIPSQVVKDFLRSTGTDGLPNLPVINQLNHGPFRAYFESLSKSDDFLKKKGLDNLTAGDVRLACTERGIVVGSKTPVLLKKELQDWMNLATKGNEALNPVYSKSGLVVNPLERRVALFAINVAREIPQTDSGRVLRAIAF